MGRKKKQVKTIKKQQSSVGYTGSITVSIQAGNKILSSKTYHNNGSNALFKFLATCLRGDYATADSMRPFYIKLFNVDSDNKTPKIIREFLASDDGYSPTGEFKEEEGIIIASNEISYNKTATLSKDETGITLHFRIPYAYIFETKINMACIYGKNSHTSKNWSAYYLLTNADTKEADAEEDWTTLTINPAKNYNLLIDWTMSISNK